MMSKANPKILIIGPAWVGDMVMAQVLFKVLKAQHPGACIDVFAPAWTQALVNFMPEVNQGIVSPFKHGELALRQRYQLARSLRHCNYDQVIVLPNSYKAGLIPFLAGIPKRTGWLGEMRWGLLNDVRKLDKAALPLMIQRFAALALSRGAELPTVLPKPKFVVDEKLIAATLHDHEIAQPTRPILALCPGAEFGNSKRWPTAHFAAVAQEKIAAGWDVWLFGSSKDWSVAEEIQSHLQHRGVNLAGRTSIVQAVALLSLARTVITNDSGLMHVAAALDVPTVAVYGSSSPQFTPPLSDKASIVSLNLSCSPCFQRECPLQHHRCMQDLLPERVLSVIAE